MLAERNNKPGIESYGAFFSEPCIIPAELRPWIRSDEYLYEHGGIKIYDFFFFLRIHRRRVSSEGEIGA